MEYTLGDDPYRPYPGARLNDDCNRALSRECLTVHALMQAIFFQRTFASIGSLKPWNVYHLFLSQVPRSLLEKQCLLPRHAHLYANVQKYNIIHSMYLRPPCRFLPS
jgi:hypothetical protein